jgi:hypothetical protein
VTITPRSQPDPHVERRAGHCACGRAWPCPHSAEGKLQALREQVQQARNDYYEQALGHGELTGHEEQEARTYGRVEMCDEVLGWLAEAERKEQLAGDLGTHAGLGDPVHHGDVLSRIEASTHD